jgi:hypothetical protein
LNHKFIDTTRGTTAALLPKRKVKKPGVKLKGLQWSKLPDAKIKDTVWGQLDFEKQMDLNWTEIEELFASNPVMNEKAARAFCLVMLYNITDSIICLMEFLNRQLIQNLSSNSQSSISI